ncbi:hypothetical protein JTB14_019872 [Gonioctena quinquepunctata]|nr:hypothetical protein JTB14_019872 [Gonioctena quinquepunctata]
MVKNTLCKHVHLVRMYKEQVGTNSVVDYVAKALGENSVIKSQNEEEIAQFIEEKRTQQISEKLEDQEDRDQVTNEKWRLKSTFQLIKSVPNIRDIILKNNKKSFQHLFLSQCTKDNPRTCHLPIHSNFN